MRLISMVDFVINTYDKTENAYESEQLMLRYAKFLKQPLELWMFVPCDEDGNVLEVIPYYADGFEKVNEYKKVKERCLFEGFQISTRKFDKSDYRLIENKDTYIYFLCNIQNKWIKVNDYKSVECLVLYNLQLTQTAIKQIS